MAWFLRVTLLISLHFSSSIFSLPHLIGTTHALPLLAYSRWIVDEKGQRVKLACVNWASHLDPMLAEGLSKQPVDVISNKIVKLGFNCVRLTWPIYLATNDSLASLTVNQSFLRLGLSQYISGLQANNPSFLHLSLLSAFQAVVASLTKNNVMVILDNHVSKPGWCCGSSDGNGFFGDEYFNPNLWIDGLTKMANLFKNNTHVIGMSLRNELRGPNQNSDYWYRYMQRGAEAVHRANPNVLVILSGLSYDTNLTFLREQPVTLNFTSKLVFEMHWYAFSDKLPWSNGNPNQVCGRVVNKVTRQAGFLLDQGFPLFVSEFGIDMTGSSVIDNRYFNCFLAWAAEHDLDWALWTLVGSYYVRQGVVGLNETFGLLDGNWSDPRNTTFLERLSLIQSPVQGPGLPKLEKHNIIFHPATGLCILRKSLKDQLKLGPCSKSDQWKYTSQKTLTIKGTNFCLLAQGLDRPATISQLRQEIAGTRWKRISDSKLHLSATLASNHTVCLDVDSNSNVVTAPCKCLSVDHTCDPGSQWFKIVDANAKIRPSPVIV